MDLCVCLHLNNGKQPGTKHSYYLHKAHLPVGRDSAIYVCIRHVEAVACEVVTHAMETAERGLERGGAWSGLVLSPAGETPLIR